jgi:hypothetical protein
MANVINYAEKWAKELLATVIQGTLTSPFITSNVKWLSAKTFHFTQMSTTGYKNHSRSGGWNRGDVNQADVPYTLYHDRDVEFLIDKADVDESNQLATIQNTSEKFTELQSNPEIDAEFFGKVSRTSIDNDLYSVTGLSTYTVANVYTRLKAILKSGNLRAYRGRGSLLMYVNSDIMDLLERSTEFTRKIEMTQVSDSGLGIQSRVTSIDGVPLIEVIDDERFYTQFDFTPSDDNGGFTPEVGSQKINVLVASLETTKKVPKISSIYFFGPGQHTEGDGYLYQNRMYSGTFVFPNGKDNAIDSIFVDYDNTDSSLTVSSEEGTESGDSLITVDETPLTGTAFYYKSDTSVTIPAIGTAKGAGWTEFESEDDLTLTNGEKIVVIEAGSDGYIDRVSAEVTVVSKA